MGTVVSFPRSSGVPDKRQGADRRHRSRGGRRTSDQTGFAPLVLLVDEDADSGARCEAILAKLRFAVARPYLSEATRVMDALRPNLNRRTRDRPRVAATGSPPDIPVVYSRRRVERAGIDDCQIRRALRKLARE